MVVSQSRSYGVAGGNTSTNGSAGSNTIFGALTAPGGGGGIIQPIFNASNAPNPQTTHEVYGGATTTYDSVQNNDAYPNTNGAGAGADATATAGGDGYLWAVSSTRYGGGGGGGTVNGGAGKAGGQGGGGAGGGSGTSATSGSTNTGGGGGGSYINPTLAASGGSGVVLVWLPQSYTLGSDWSGGTAPTVSSLSYNSTSGTLVTFTASGTWTPTL